MIIEIIKAVTSIFSANIAYKAYKHTVKKDENINLVKEKQLSMSLRHKVIPQLGEEKEKFEVKIANRDIKSAYAEDIYWSNEYLRCIWDVKDDNGLIPHFISKEITPSKSETAALDINSLFSGIWPGVKLTNLSLFSYIKYAKVNVKNSFDEVFSCELPQPLRKQLFLEKAGKSIFTRVLSCYI